MADKELTTEELPERIGRVTGGTLPDPNPADYASMLEKAKFKQRLELISLKLVIKIIVYLLIILGSGLAVANHYLFH